MALLPYPNCEHVNLGVAEMCYLGVIPECFKYYMWILTRLLGTSRLLNTTNGNISSHQAFNSQLLNMGLSCFQHIICRKRMVRDRNIARRISYINQVVHSNQYRALFRVLLLSQIFLSSLYALCRHKIARVW